MSTFFSRLAHRALGTHAAVQPLVAPRFAPEEPEEELDEEANAWPEEPVSTRVVRETVSSTVRHVHVTEASPHPVAVPRSASRDASPGPVARSAPQLQATTPTVAKLSRDVPLMPSSASRAVVRETAPASIDPVRATPVASDPPVVPASVDAPLMPPSVEAAREPAPVAEAPVAAATAPGVTTGASAPSAVEPASGPVIRVSIGRIDVRAIQPAARAPRPAPSAPKPPLSLEEYLKQRDGGRR